MNRTNADNIIFHDPLIVKHEGEYYCFSTDQQVNGVQIARSNNLLDWELLAPGVADIPEELTRHLGKVYFWAPELVERDGKFRLYSCSSKFGKTQSVIALFESDEIVGPYEFRGEVLKTYAREDKLSPNALDANIIRSKAGNDYLIYGSFFAGIFAVKLNEDGFIAEDSYGTLIAGGNHTAIKGAYMHYREEEDLYYLFVSYGSLANDYNIRVASSKSVTGPFVDSQGFKLTDMDPIRSVGDKILSSYNFDIQGEIGYRAPGHNSLLHIDEGTFIVHHVRLEDRSRMPELQVRKLYFLEDGKIIASPVVLNSPENLNENRDLIFEQVISPNVDFDFSQFKLSVIVFDRFNNSIVYGRKLASSTLNIRVLDEKYYVLDLDDQSYKGLLIKNDNKYYLATVNEVGEALWVLLYKDEEVGFEK